MTVKNTRQNYGSVAKLLHWSIALLFLMSYCTVYFRHWFTEEKTPENWIALQLHLSVGITVAAIVVLRILWRLSNRVPDPEPGPSWADRVAHIGHYLLYAVMIVMPLTGYIGTGVNTEYFMLFDIPKFESTALFDAIVTQGLGMSFEEFEKPIDTFHKEIMGEYVLLLLIFGHIAAALYHHFVLEDRTLKKMTSGK